MINPFFTNKGPFIIENLLSLIDVDNRENYKGSIISDIKDLVSAKKNDVSFFHSKRYETLASKTEASFCVTTKNLSNLLPKNCSPIIVENVLITTALITKTLYPDAITDDFDDYVQDINKISFNKKVKYGKNILIGKNVKIGNKSIVAAGSVVTKDIPDFSVCGGVPATLIKMRK